MSHFRKYIIQKNNCYQSNIVRAKYLLISEHQKFLFIVNSDSQHSTFLRGYYDMLQS